MIQLYHISLLYTHFFLKADFYFISVFARKYFCTFVQIHPNLDQSEYQLVRSSTVLDHLLYFPKHPMRNRTASSCTQNNTFIFAIYFFNLLFIDQICSMASYKFLSYLIFDFLHFSKKFNTFIFCMYNNLMFIYRSLKKQNFLILQSNPASAPYDRNCFPVSACNFTVFLHNMRHTFTDLLL